MRAFAKVRMEEYVLDIYGYALEYNRIGDSHDITFIAEQDAEFIGEIGAGAMFLAMMEAEYFCEHTDSDEDPDLDSILETYQVETIYDRYISIGDYIWKIIADDINGRAISVKSEQTDETTPIHMQRSGFIVYLVYALDRDLLIQFIPSIEKIAKLFPEIGEELWNYHKLYQDSRSVKIDKFGKFQNVDMPYQIHSDLYEGSEITRLMQLLQQIGEFRPEGDYDDSMKLEIHHDILKLLDKINPDQIQIPNE